MIIIDATALRDAHCNRVARRERLLDRTIELLVQVLLRVLWKSLVSSGHDVAPWQACELVGHGRAAQLLKRNPADRGTGRCCTRSRSHLTHLRSHITRNLPGFP